MDIDLQQAGRIQVFFSPHFLYQRFWRYCSTAAPGQM